MKKLTFGITALLLLTVTAVLFAEGIVVPDGDPLTALLTLIQNFGAAAPIGKAILVIVLLVQAMKKFFPAFQYQELFTLFAGLVYGFLQALQSGMSWLNAGIFVVITSGGAILVYDYFLKHPLNALFKIKPAT